MSSGYPPGWAKLSESVKVAAGYQCEWCRRKGFVGAKAMGMVTAHLDQVHSNCVPSNLACLCRLCHNHYDSYGVSPLLPKGEIRRRIAFLSDKAMQTVEMLKGLAGKYPRTKKTGAPLEWAYEVSCVAGELKVILNILQHYRSLRHYSPARTAEAVVPATWKGYMNLFGTKG